MLRDLARRDVMESSLSLLLVGEHDSAVDAAVLLRRWGHRVKQVDDPLGAVIEARLSKPDLILIDLTAPGRNSLESDGRLIQALRMDGARLAALISASTDASIHDLKRAGVKDCLKKPVMPLELLMLIVKTREAIVKSAKAQKRSRLREACRGHADIRPPRRTA
jgi:CheY-like chemotaxis protein